MQNTTNLLQNKTLYSQLNNPFSKCKLSVKWQTQLHPSVINLKHSCLCLAKAFCRYSVTVHFRENSDKANFKRLKIYKHTNRVIFFRFCPQTTVDQSVAHSAPFGEEWGGKGGMCTIQNSLLKKHHSKLKYIYSTQKC